MLRLYQDQKNFKRARPQTFDSIKKVSKTRAVSTSNTASPARVFDATNSVGAAGGIIGTVGQTVGHGEQVSVAKTLTPNSSH